MKGGPVILLDGTHLFDVKEFVTTAHFSIFVILLTSYSPNLPFPLINLSLLLVIAG